MTLRRSSDEPAIGCHHCGRDLHNRIDAVIDDLADGYPWACRDCAVDPAVTQAWYLAFRMEAPFGFTTRVQLRGSEYDLRLTVNRATYRQPWFTWTIASVLPDVGVTRSSLATGHGNAVSAFSAAIVSILGPDEWYAPTEESPSDYFGGCPVCGGAVFLNVGKGNYAACRKHLKAWCIGARWFSGWVNETVIRWARNVYFLDMCEEVEPVYATPDEPAATKATADVRTDEFEIVYQRPDI